MIGERHGPIGVGDGERVDVIAGVGERDGSGRGSNSERCGSDGLSLCQISTDRECRGTGGDSCCSDTDSQIILIGERHGPIGVGDGERVNVVLGVGERDGSGRGGDIER